jgi:hypothetical protein
MTEQKGKILDSPPVDGDGTVFQATRYEVFTAFDNNTTWDCTVIITII